MHMTYLIKLLKYVNRHFMVAPKATKLTSFPRDQFLTNIAHGATVNCYIVSSQIFCSITRLETFGGKQFNLSHVRNRRSVERALHRRRSGSVSPREALVCPNCVPLFVI